MQSETVKEYVCDRHGYQTTSPRKALDHIKGDMVDEVFAIGAKVTKAALGIPAR